MKELIKKDDLDDFVSEECLDKCQYLYDSLTKIIDRDDVAFYWHTDRSCVVFNVEREFRDHELTNPALRITVSTFYVQGYYENNSLKLDFNFDDEDEDMMHKTLNYIMNTFE